jgi:pimeloyl-ACP methyl ester carboxylesterase
MFEFRDRGYTETMLLVPGWAFDERIFQCLDLPYNYLLATNPEMSSLESQVVRYDETHDQTPMAMLGWSQGGIALSQLAGRCPERVTQLILVGIRPGYPREGLLEIRRLLDRSRTAYLKCFYKACFAGSDESIRSWFNKTLLDDYLEKFTHNTLTAGLDWLAQACIDPEDLKQVPSVTVIHGTDDTIAPIQEAKELAAKMPLARWLVLQKTGHVSFLHAQFPEKLYDRQKTDSV